ncbi:dihydrolipoyl dehydrogenase [Aureimonas psammosilenae]|uniref:dihydrolipoyl dehydrogenase n=1 Tax=Aureimonas psammosilenae TaxID=2495496 RepID=UPI0012610685|nr:dihydrolipoyl dehydrogenase [Aureimonas psammosilenae]
MPDLSCDVAVIGAGTAGRAAERSARRHGAKTLLIDEAFSGTTCVAVGCMPSKLLIAAGEAAHAVRQAHVFGVKAPPPEIDGRAVMERVRRERDKFLASDLQTIEDLPEGVAVKAKARFAGPTTLVLDDGRTVKARTVVIATGSYPAVPESFDSVSNLVLTNETIFELPTLPASVAVIGAGALGLELAQALSRLGVEITVFDKSKEIAGLEDEAVEASLREILLKEFAILTEVETEGEPAEGGVLVKWSGKERGEKRFDHVLVSAGRPPRLKDLDLEKSGIELGDKGVPVFRETTMQCGASPVFIAGDADASRPILHEASDEGTIAGRNAALHPTVEPVERSVPFILTFTDPPVAVIGTVPDADNKTVVTGKASYADQGRAKVMARNAGLVHFYATRDGGRIIGASMAAPAVEHMAHLVAFAVQEGKTAAELLDMPFYHPTFEEGLKPALREICEAAGTLAPSRDEARPSAP